LAERNLPWVREQYEQQKQERLARQGLDRKALELLPANAAQLIAQMKMGSGVAIEDVQNAVRVSIPRESDRAKVYLQFLGLEEVPWNQHGGREMLYALYLNRPTTVATCQALEENPGDEELMWKGASRWFFSTMAWVEMDADIRDRLLPRLTRMALTSSEEYNRRLVIRILECIGDAEARSLLHQVIRGAIVLPEVGSIQKKASPMIFPALSAEERCSARALAALAIARLRDKQSLPMMRQLSLESKGDDKKALQILTTNR
jgi:hypothetical protein